MIIPKSLPSDGNCHWAILTPPTIEPITVDELKLFARIDGDDEDSLLSTFIKAVREGAERYLGRALIRQTITMKMDFWPGDVIELPRPPLISITQVATIDEDDAETVYSSDYYYIITEATPGLLCIRQGFSYPINTDRDHGGYKIDWLAGYGLTDLYGSLSDCTSNGTTTITKTGHGLTPSEGDIVDITDCTTTADKGLYRVVSYTDNTIVVDRALSGSDTDVDLTIYQSTLVPQTINDGVKLWAASMYENRVITPTPPPEAKLLLDVYRVPEI